MVPSIEASAIPWVGGLTTEIVEGRMSSSGSVSLARTSMATAVASLVVAVSSAVTGAPPETGTWTLTVAVPQVLDVSHAV